MLVHKMCVFCRHVYLLFRWYVSTLLFVIPLVIVILVRIGTIAWWVRAFVCQVGGRGFDSWSGKICRDLFLALQQWRMCVSRGSHDHVNG